MKWVAAGWFVSNSQTIHMHTAKVIAASTVFQRLKVRQKELETAR